MNGQQRKLPVALRPALLLGLWAVGALQGCSCGGTATELKPQVSLTRPADNQALTSTDDEDKAAQGDRLIDATLTLIHTHGTLHADPHPGNFLVLDDDATSANTDEEALELLKAFGLPFRKREAEATA